MQRARFLLGLAVLAASGLVACGRASADLVPVDRLDAAAVEPEPEGGATTSPDATTDAPPPTDSGDAAPPPDAHTPDAESADAADGDDSGSRDAGDSGHDADCSLGAQECSVGGTIETCGADGQWGDPWPCASGACSDGACTQPATTTAPSCAFDGAGMTNCGDAGTESCCTSLEVAGGTYDRTYTYPDVHGTDPATVSGFRLDKYEVTVGRFRQFVNAVLLPDGGLAGLPGAGAGKHTHLNGGQGLVSAGAVAPDGGAAYEPGWDATDWNDPTYVDPTNANLGDSPTCGVFATWTGGDDNRPITCVNWWESYAFCIWDGGFLPSETEWEYAAAGGSEQREYPWGSASPGTDCPGTGCEYAIYDCDYPSGVGTCSGAFNGAPVGTAAAGAGRWGQLDLAGNAFEWNVDGYAPYVDPCIDCAYLTAASYRLIRGGGYGDIASRLVPPFRGEASPVYRGGTSGLRCARTP